MANSVHRTAFSSSAAGHTSSALVTKPVAGDMMGNWVLRVINVVLAVTGKSLCGAGGAAAGL